MIRTAFAAATLLLAVPASAQSQQERLDARYARALAAGYKALMLCSAIANAEANGTMRTPESVAKWELTGIQAPLDFVVGDLPFRIERFFGDGEVFHVAVDWAQDASPRYAVFGRHQGCALLPIGAAAPKGVTYHVGGGAVWHLQQAARTRQFVIGADPAEQSKGSRTRTKAMRNPASVPFDGAFAGRYGSTRTTAVLVLHNLGEGASSTFARYAEGFDENTPQRTWSVAKSIAATLVGAAVLRGEADVKDSAGLGHDLADPRRAITIDHLLRMASGRYSDTPGNRTDPLYWGGATVDESAQTTPLIAVPGSTYRYANNDTLGAVMAIAPSFMAHPPAALFAKLGMTGTVAETDWQGNYVLSSQVWSTANDLAALGQLYLNDGKLPDGTRILPEGWVQYVSTPSGPQPPNGTFGYGAGFWLLNKEEGVPPDTFAAIGNRGQYVVIVPSRQVVIVRRGEDPVGSGFDIAAFTRDVLAALPAE